MMRISWFATTALAAVLGSGVAFAQSHEPQRHEEKGAPHAQQEHQQKAGPQAQQERGGTPGAQNAQREERGEKNKPSLAQRPEGDGKAKGREESTRQAQHKGPGQSELNKQGNEARQNAQGEKAAQGTAEQKSASETKKDHERSAREESKRPGHDKGKKHQAKAPEHNPSGQAQDTTQKDTQSKSGRSQNTAQGRQTPDSRNGKQNQAATPSKDNKAPSTATNTNTNTNAGTSAAQNNDPSRQNNASTTSTSNTSSSSSTASAKLSETDRTKVFSRLKHEKTTTRENVNIQVNVGTRLPQRVRPHRLPSDIVTIMPEYRGYDYVMVQDEIAIVRPGTREVVDVIHEGGPTVARSESSRSTHITLSSQQRQLLLREAKPMTSAQVSSRGSSCLSLQPVPDSIASHNPDLRGLQLLKIGDEAVLVDPKDQKIVDVIRQ